MGRDRRIPVPLTPTANTYETRGKILDHTYSNFRIRTEVATGSKDKNRRIHVLAPLSGEGTLNSRGIKQRRSRRI